MHVRVYVCVYIQDDTALRACVSGESMCRFHWFGRNDNFFDDGDLKGRVFIFGWNNLKTLTSNY